MVKDYSLALSLCCTSIVILLVFILLVIKYYSEINLYPPELSDTYGYLL